MSLVAQNYSPRASPSPPKLISVEALVIAPGMAHKKAASVGGLVLLLWLVYLAVGAIHAANHL